MSVRAAAPAAALALLAACSGGEPGAGTPAPSYAPALAALVKELESRRPPIVLPSLEPARAKELVDLLETFVGSRGTRIARGAREEIEAKGAEGAAAIVAFGTDPKRNAADRVAALEALDKLEPAEAAAEAACSVAERADDGSVRAAAARAAGKRGERFVVARFLLRLKYETSESAVIELADALAALGNLSGVAALAEVVRRGNLEDAASRGAEFARRAGAPPNDASPTAVIAALDAVARAWREKGAPPSAPPADERLNLELARAASLLGERDLRFVDDARYVLAGGGGEAVPCLVAALQEPSAFTRVRAMEVLGWLGPVSAPALDRLLALRGDPAHRGEPLVALGRTEDRRATPALLEALKDKDPELRVAAARGLFALRDPASAAPLRDALAAHGRAGTTPQPDVALLAASMLVELDDLSVVPALVELAADGKDVEPGAASAALDAAFAKIRARKLDDAGYAKAETPEAKRAAAKRWLERAAASKPAR